MRSSCTPCQSLPKVIVHASHICTCFLVLSAKLPRHRVWQLYGDNDNHPFGLSAWIVVFFGLQLFLSQVHWLAADRWFTLLLRLGCRNRSIAVRLSSAAYSPVLCVRVQIPNFQQLRVCPPGFGCPTDKCCSILSAVSWICVPAWSFAEKHVRPSLRLPAQLFGRWLQAD